MAVPNLESIATHLFRAAESRTFERGVRFAPEVSSNMKKMAAHGAHAILEAAHKKPDGMAERSVRAGSRVGAYTMVVFVDEMATQRLLTPDYIKNHGNELREDLWTKVRDILCPIWPIC
jgi:hypothetical protein